MTDPASNQWLNGLNSRPLTPLRPQNAPSAPTAGNQSFAEALKQASSENLKVSAHASARLSQRGLQLSAEDWTRVNQAVNQAQEKGSRNAYVVYGKAGFVVNVPNRTVVTAMVHQEDMVVTQIDSVVIVQGPDH